MNWSQGEGQLDFWITKREGEALKWDSWFQCVLRKGLDKGSSLEITMDKDWEVWSGGEEDVVMLAAYSRGKHSSLCLLPLLWTNFTTLQHGTAGRWGSEAHVWICVQLKHMCRSTYSWSNRLKIGAQWTRKQPENRSLFRVGGWKARRCGRTEVFSLLFVCLLSFWRQNPFSSESLELNIQLKNS